MLVHTSKVKGIKNSFKRLKSWANALNISKAEWFLKTNSGFFKDSVEETYLYNVQSFIDISQIVTSHLWFQIIKPWKTVQIFLTFVLWSYNRRERKCCLKSSFPCNILKLHSNPYVCQVLPSGLHLTKCLGIYIIA